MPYALCSMLYALCPLLFALSLPPYLQPIRPLFQPIRSNHSNDHLVRIGNRKDVTHMARVILRLAFDFIVPFVVRFTTNALAEGRYSIAFRDGADFVSIEAEVGGLISRDEIYLQFGK